MGHICRRLSQRRQAAGPGELLAQHGHLTMTVSDFHTLLPEHLGGRLDAHVHRFVQAFEPLEDIVQAPRDDADFVQTVDRHAGIQLAGGSPLHRLTHARESSDTPVAVPLDPPGASTSRMPLNANQNVVSP